MALGDDEVRPFHTHTQNQRIGRGHFKVERLIKVERLSVEVLTARFCIAN